MTSLLKAQNYITSCQEQIRQLKTLLQKEEDKVKQLISKSEQSSNNEDFVKINQVKEEFSEILRQSEEEKKSLQLEINNLKSQLRNLEQVLDSKEKTLSLSAKTENDIKSEVNRLIEENGAYRSKIANLETELEKLGVDLQKHKN